MNINFVVYDRTGKILRWGSCLPDVAMRQAQDGEFVIEGEGNPRDHKVVDGKVISKSQFELSQIEKEERIMKNEMERFKKIRERGQQILDNMAIKELEKEGKL